MSGDVTDGGKNDGTALEGKDAGGDIYGKDRAILLSVEMDGYSVYKLFSPRRCLLVLRTHRYFSCAVLRHRCIHRGGGGCIHFQDCSGLLICEKECIAFRGKNVSAFPLTLPQSLLDCILLVMSVIGASTWIALSSS
jgi:hypothetical protein